MYSGRNIRIPAATRPFGMSGYLIRKKLYRMSHRIKRISQICQNSFVPIFFLYAYPNRPTRATRDIGMSIILGAVTVPNNIVK